MMEAEKNYFPLGMKVTVAARLFRKAFELRTTRMGITRTQWGALAVVASQQGATQRKIAAELDITEVSAGRLIDKLCRDGLLERRQDPGDRRSHRIYLQAAAAPVIEQLRLFAQEQDHVAFTGFTLEELAAMDNMLERIAINLSGKALGAQNRDT
jgi:MarR family transcriptional regulator for hemolysin